LIRVDLSLPRSARSINHLAASSTPIASARWALLRRLGRRSRPARRSSISFPASTSMPPPWLRCSSASARPWPPRRGGNAGGSLRDPAGWFSLPRGRDISGRADRKVRLLSADLYAVTETVRRGKQTLESIH